MATGAFGSHGLRKRAGITPDSIHAWETASHYAVRLLFPPLTPFEQRLIPLGQVFNGLALMLISFHPRFAVHRFAGPAIAAGGAVFTGTIFGLVLARDKYAVCFHFLCAVAHCGSLTRFRWLGPITPLGGTLMMIGYVPFLPFQQKRPSICRFLPGICLLRFEYSVWIERVKEAWFGAEGNSRGTNL